MDEFRRLIRRRIESSVDVEEPLRAEVVEELAGHLADVYQDARSRGLDEETARARAIADLGSDEQLAAAVRRARRSRRRSEPWKRGGMGVDRPGLRERCLSVLRDLRIGVRVMRQRPVFTVAALLTLAVGIGANSAVFSMVHGVLLRPLPFPGSERIVRIWRTMPELPGQAGPLTDAEFERFAGLDLIEVASAFGDREVTLTTPGGESLRVAGASVSDGFERVLGLQVESGRWLESGSGAEVVVSSSLAERLFGVRDDVVGESLELDGLPHTVVGVLPTDLALPRQAELWLPRPTLAAGGLGSTGDGQQMRFASLHVLARLEEEASLERLRVALGAIGTGGERATGDVVGTRYGVVALLDSIVGDVEGMLVRFALAVGMVLLIACANVANLLLEQTASRQEEFAVRLAMGAGRARLLRQHLVESLALGLGGATLGVLTGWVGIRTFVAINPLEIPRIEQVGLDGATLLFTLGLGLLTGMLFGLAPAVRAAGASVSEVLREGTDVGAGRGWAGGFLAGVEIALATALLIGAGLLVNSFLRMATLDPGYEVDSLVVAEVRVAHELDAAVANAAVRELPEWLSRVPGVTGASVTTAVPPIGTGERELLIEGQPIAEADARPRAAVLAVGSGYFDALGIPVLRGRGFGRDDVIDERPVALVNEALVAEYLREGGVLGRRFLLDGSLVEIVGVVGNARQADIREEPGPVVYLPRVRPVSEISMGGRKMSMVLQTWMLVRVAEDPSRAVTALRGAAEEMPDGIHLDGIEVLSDRVWQSVAAPRFFAATVGAFALSALLLASIGVYAVMSYAVSRRTHDLGVRMAMGAGPGDVVGLVMRKGLTVILGGAAVGVAGALLLNRALEGFLYAVEATDLPTYALVVLFLSTVAAVAAYLPARRAVRIDPVDALRIRPQ